MFSNYRRRRRVRAGIKTLDRRINGDWRAFIDPEKLDVSIAQECPLGFIFGDYQNGLTVLGLSNQEAYLCGFTSHVNPAPYIGEAEYILLTKIWQEELAHSA